MISSVTISGKQSSNTYGGGYWGAGRDIVDVC
jgi:hypothetical protein